MKIVRRDDNSKRSYPTTYTPFRSIFDDFFTPTVWEEFLASPTTYSNLSADVWEEKDDVFVKWHFLELKRKT
jgi:hypothetical protein